MSLILYPATALLLIQACILLWNIITWKSRARPTADQDPDIAVLIPARNEYHNLPGLIEKLKNQSVQASQIIICDDGSEDGTRAWLEENARQLGVEWFTSAQRPEGWVGKSWACHQLGHRACADWLVFIDADTEPSVDFVQILSGIFCNTDATLVTGMSRVIPTGLGDALLVGMVPFSVFSMLPLNLAEHFNHPGLAFANGQVMCFRRSDYLTLEPHQMVRFAFVEDMQLARMMKRLGRTVYIGDFVDCFGVHMYGSVSEALDGFAKNAVEIAGSVGSAILISVVLAATYLAPLAVLASGERLAIVPVVLAGALYGASVAMAGLPAWFGLLYPAAVGLGIAAFARSVLWRVTGRVEWKGRTYDPSRRIER